MTTTLAASDIAARLGEKLPGSVVEVTPSGVYVPVDKLTAVAQFLRDDPDLAFDVLEMETAVDYLDGDYIEVVYLLLSLSRNHRGTIKVRTDGRDDPVVPSVIEIWRTAEFQEREIYDLFGVRFAGHPDLRRLFMWDEFRGYPLRKDFLSMSQ